VAKQKSAAFATLFWVGTGLAALFAGAGAHRFGGGAVTDGALLARRSRRVRFRTAVLAQSVLALFDQFEGGLLLFGGCFVRWCVAHDALNLRHRAVLVQQRKVN
jgi:hypothetical protein